MYLGYRRSSPNRQTIPTIQMHPYRRRHRHLHRPSFITYK
jgi:hypothetical protein